MARGLPATPGRSLRRGSARGRGRAIDRLRDGAFAAAGLDYPSELAGWLAPEIALAVFEGAGPALPAPGPARLP